MSNTIRKMPIHKSGANISETSPHFDKSLPLTWYPIALSKDLKNLKHFSFTLFGEDWIVFRTKKGSLGVTSRFCCHIGTDLSNGKVVNECIECPMHGWQFNTNGICEHIPSQKNIPKTAQIKKLIVEEHFGIVFVFYNQTALFGFEELFGSVENLKYSASKVVPIDAPACIIALNTFDTQHYKNIHSREFVETPEVNQPSRYCLKLSYTAKIIKHRFVDYVIDKLTASETTVSIEAWGGNLLLLRNENTQLSCLVSVKPVSDEKSIVYITAIKESRDKRSFFRNISDKLMLNIAASIFKSYLSPDIRVIANTRPIHGVLLKESDAVLSTFFAYWEKLPKCPPSSSLGS